MKIVIFCGGYGTRMWPASRKSFPKQFYPLVGGKSLFQLTYGRFRKEYKPEDIFFSAEENYVKFIKNQAKEASFENIILEPERRDTLGAVGLVATVISKRFPDEIIFFSWSDHLIGQEDKFLRAVQAAGEYSKTTGLPVSVNEEPTYPSVHLGWLKVGDAVDEYKGFQIRKIERFIEKPDFVTAKKLFQVGGYLFHTGYEAWPLKLLLSYYQELVPDIYRGLMKISEAIGTKYESTVLYREYHKFEKDSVDYGVFEKITPDKRLTIATNVTWEDSGTWELLYKALRKNELENVVEGQGLIEFIDSSSNLVMGHPKKVISLIGMKNTVVIDTADGLLVCNMSETDKVKALFKKLEKEKPEFIE